MSAILSADDLNDFISPGVACIKPVETLPKQQPAPLNPWEVTTEEKVAAAPTEASAAQISLTDCLACSGCVTSAEAVLVSLQSHQEVLNTLDSYASVDSIHSLRTTPGAKIFVASVSPQTRASLAATYGTTVKEAGHMIEQLLSGTEGLKSGGKHGGGFTWVLDTNFLRTICLKAVVREVEDALSSTPTCRLDTTEPSDGPKLPVLASACPGWICYAEKTHPHVLPHISRVKSPQALAGTLLKSVLSKRLGVSPDRIWHLAIMPCFDKKLEASRAELTDAYWMPDMPSETGVRDVDCVITARELIMLADSRGISFPSLSRRSPSFESFPDPELQRYLFPRGRRLASRNIMEGGPSGGYAYAVLQELQRRISGSKISIERGRNLDVVEYVLTHNGVVVMKTARYFGFRNIQNLVRKLKPPKRSKMPGARLAGGENRRSNLLERDAGSNTGLGEYAYIEVMACPGGCTNGGGQIKYEDVATFAGQPDSSVSGPSGQKQWLAKVDEAYFSASSSSEDEESEQPSIDADCDTSAVMDHWASITDVTLDRLIFTKYREVESDVGKKKELNDIERVAGLASSLGGGW